MIDNARIDEEAAHFFEWPGADHSTVTFTSAVLFARCIAEMVRKECADAALKEQT